MNYMLFWPFYSAMFSFPYSISEVFATCYRQTVGLSRTTIPVIILPVKLEAGRFLIIYLNISGRRTLVYLRCKSL